MPESAPSSNAMRASALLLVLGLCACEAPSGTFARFAPPASGPVPLYALPFPNDLYLGADGTVEIGDIPGASAAVRNTLIELDERRGFSRIGTVSFPIDGALDPNSIPADAAPDGVASTSDAVVLIDEAGDPIPLLVDYHAEIGSIVLRPRYGIVLDPEARYVAAITDSIRGADGAPLRASPVFAAVRDGTSTDASGERARPFIEDALRALDAAGLRRERVVSATVFTAARTDGLLRELDAIGRAAPAPAFSFDRLWRRGAELDALFGVPSEDRPGVDVAPADGVGESAVVHDAIAFVVSGTFETPRVVTGDGTDIGLLRREAGGAVVTGPVPERVPYVLIVPDVPDLGALPVVIVHHGLPGTKILGLQIGNTFARMGMAVLAYDAFQNGGRAPTANDTRNVLRGIEEPDGLAEHADADVPLRVLGFTAEGDRIDHWLAAVAQVITDLVVALRALREGEIAAIASADPDLAGISFDPDGIYYVGQSFGGLAGMSALPLFERVQAAAFFVGPPDLTENLCSGPLNRALFETIALRRLGLRRPFEEAGRRLCMTPEAELFRWLGEPVSPASLLHYALREPIHDGEPPDLLFAYATFDELLGAPSGEHVLGIAGVPVMGRTFLTAPPPIEATIARNYPTPNGSITAAGWVFESDHSVIRARDAHVGFEVPFAPPFVMLEQSRPHTNPIEDAHALVRHFFETRRTTGRAEVPDPSSL
jgi:dienelactone hydrolase